MDREEYIKFMRTKSNAFKCDKCPSNYGYDNSNSSHLADRYPCGQYHCWVLLHCKSMGEIKGE